MLNLYSCGCYAEGDIPTLSRCEEHNGFIVAVTGKPRTRTTFKSGRILLWHDSLEENLKRLPDAKFAHIFSYPDHDVFYAYHHTAPHAWRNAEPVLLQHLKRLLKPGGYATLIVDGAVLHTLLYHAALVGLDAKVNRVLYKEFVPEPMYSRSYEFTDAKIMVDIYAGEKKNLPDSGEYVLDTSSILLDRVKRRAKSNKIVALCSCPSRFLLIKRDLSGAP